MTSSWSRLNYQLYLKFWFLKRSFASCLIFATLLIDIFSKFLSEGECEDFLDSLEKLHVAHLGENSPFFAGKELTYADLQLLVTFDLMKDLSFEELIAQNAPNLARIADSVADLPELREYVEENENVAVVAAGMLFWNNFE